MRDLFVIGLLGVAILFTFRYPFVGILGWTWISFLNPHRLSFGFAFDFPMAVGLGATVIFAYIFSKEPKRPPPYPLFWIVVALLFWIQVTTLFAYDIQWSKEKWETSSKVLIMALLTTVMLTTRERIHAFVWVVVLTLGYYGIKGGAFTIITGGNNRVWGPPGSFLASNNQLALALIATIPLMYHLLTTTPLRWMKIGIWGAIILTFFSVIGSHSRGAFLGVIAMAGFFVWRTRYKGPALVATLLVVLVGIWFVPEHWIARMDTIDDYEADASAMSRIEIWTFAVKLALDNPITGGGFHVSSIQELFFSYMPDGSRGRSFHSVWFEMLGAHGFVGLAIFITMVYLTWSNCSLIRRKTRDVPQLNWAYDLASMIQVSLIGYLAAGTFLNLAFFDLIYALIGIVVGTRLVIERELSEAMAKPIERSKGRQVVGAPAKSKPPLPQTASTRARKPL